MRLPPRPRAVITGAASGFGRALASALAPRGARLLLSDVDDDGLAETARLAEEAGAVEVRTLRCDVRDPDQVEAQAARADEAFGGADLVVNNAGVAVVGPVGDVSLEDWRWQIDINLWGVIYGCHSHAPRMKKQGSGIIINVASSAGLIAAPTMGPYNVSKAGVIALSETLAGELAGTGVSVTVPCPMFFRTNIHKSTRSTVTRGRKQTEKLVTESKWSAEKVAEITIAAAERGELYVIPQPDGRAFWRAKRLLGGRFYSAVGQVIKNPRIGKWLAR